MLAGLPGAPWPRLRVLGVDDFALRRGDSHVAVVSRPVALHSRWRRVKGVTKKPRWFISLVVSLMCSRPM